jgi:hypothetical protein
MKNYPLTIGMTPAFYDENNMLLRMQLNCLSKQTVKDFDVWLIDPHYNKRKNIIPELSDIYKLDIKHIPYIPNQNIAKKLDCSIFNAVYCYSTSPKIVRYSCYRFVKENFAEVILSVKNNINIDFYSLNVGPCMKEEQIRNSGNLIEHEKHRIVWDFENDEINWDQVPQHSGCFTDGQWNYKDCDSLARWCPLSDTNIDTPVITPLNCYGNIMWCRNNWFEINGTNEVFTNYEHWEDVDFDNRSNIAEQKVVRKTKLMYRLFHHHGGFSQRSNVEIDFPCKELCFKCKLMANYDGHLRNKRIRRDFFDVRKNSGELEIFENIMMWVCKDCKLSGPYYNYDSAEYNDYIKHNKLIKAPIINKYKIGRNLQILMEDMDKTSSIENKIEIYNNSWDNERYYHK